MRRTAFGVELDAEDASRRHAEAALGWLAVHEEPRARRRHRSPASRRRCRVLRRRQTADRRASHRRAQAIRGRDLRGQDAFRVARSAAVEPVAVDRGSERTAGRSRNAWTARRPARPRPPAASRRRCRDRRRPAARSTSNPSPRSSRASHRPASPSRPVVESMSIEAARERYRIHASSSVRVSVRESRYLTMTGVASDSCHSGPLPAVTARAPGRPRRLQARRAADRPTA